MTQEKLNVVLEKHKKWLKNQVVGVNNYVIRCNR